MAAISKEEYLKRYLSPADGGVKKKRKKRNPTKPARKECGMKIVDDDVSWDTFAPKADEYDEVDDKLLTLDEKPQVENVDNRTAEEKKLDEFKRSKMWRSLGEESSESRKNRQDSDDDMDLPRRSKQKNIDATSDDDLNVPRKNKLAISRRRHDSDSDLDFPRSNTQTKAKQRKKKPRHDSDSDLSVERDAVGSESDSDLDIPRKKRQKSSLLKKKRHDSDSDLEIPRTKRNKSSRGTTQNSDSDLDIPRTKKLHKRRHDSDSDLEVKRNTSANKSAVPETKMISGGRGGLTSVDLLRLEMEKLKKKETQMEKMANEYKDSTTVYRERGTGKRRDMQKEKEEKDEEDEKRKKKEEQYDKWGRGLKQVAMRAEAIADTIHESGKSLSRYNDDADLEAMRKAEMREGDPMAEYIARKKQKEKGNSAKEYPKYRGPAPAPNRFKLQPGYRWDGVDRSNGFEKRYFDSLSERQAFKDEYYKWSVNDL